MKCVFRGVGVYLRLSSLDLSTGTQANNESFVATELKFLLSKFRINI